MSRCNHNDELLRELRAPRRNNYFYGKRLDVQHFRMEQDYGKEKQWLLNRLTLGKGVLCGLGISVIEGKLCVSPGAAIDGLGREIIVPVHTCIAPWPAPDPCQSPQPNEPGHDDTGNNIPGSAIDADGNPIGADPDADLDPTNPSQPSTPNDPSQPGAIDADGNPIDPGPQDPTIPPGQGDDQERLVTLWLCYRECTTDQMPVLVADCDIKEQCAPGTIIETFSLKVTHGSPPILRDPSWCAELCAGASSPEPGPNPDPGNIGGPGNLTSNRGTIDASVNLSERLDNNLASGTVNSVNASTNFTANPDVDDPRPPRPIDPWLTSNPDEADSCRRQVCELLDCDCDPDSGDPCVPLAVVALHGTEITDIEICAIRPRIYSNAKLLDLILCLSKRLDECCCDSDSDPTPDPVTPLLQITNLRFYRDQDDPAAFESTTAPLSIRRLNVGPVAIEAQFSKALHQPSLVTAESSRTDPNTINVRLIGAAGLIPCRLIFPEDDILRIEINEKFAPLEAGRYRLQLLSKPEPGELHPAIVDADNMFLDGEPNNRFPSGDGNEGGDFQITFSVSRRARG